MPTTTPDKPSFATPGWSRLVPKTIVSSSSPGSSHSSILRYPGASSVSITTSYVALGQGVVQRLRDAEAPRAVPTAEQLPEVERDRVVVAMVVVQVRAQLVARDRRPDRRGERHDRHRVPGRVVDDVAVAHDLRLANVPFGRDHPAVVAAVGVVADLAEREPGRQVRDRAVEVAGTHHAVQGREFGEHLHHRGHAAPSVRVVVDRLTSRGTPRRRGRRRGPWARRWRRSAAARGAGGGPGRPPRVRSRGRGGSDAPSQDGEQALVEAAVRVAERPVVHVAADLAQEVHRPADLEGLRVGRQRVEPDVVVAVASDVHPVALHGAQLVQVDVELVREHGLVDRDELAKQRVDDLRPHRRGQAALQQALDVDDVGRVPPVRVRVRGPVVGRRPEVVRAPRRIDVRFHGGDHPAGGRRPPRRAGSGSCSRRGRAVPGSLGPAGRTSPGTRGWSSSGNTVR